MKEQKEQKEKKIVEKFYPIYIDIKDSFEKYYNGFSNKKYLELNFISISPYSNGTFEEIKVPFSDGEQYDSLYKYNHKIVDNILLFNGDYIYGEKIIDKLIGDNIGMNIIINSAYLIYDQDTYHSDVVVYYTKYPPFYYIKNN